jgi:hypothetical protein
MTMGDVQKELERLRRDVDELLARVAAGEPSAATDRSTSDLANEACVRHLKAAMEREGKTRGIGIFRVVVLVNEGHSSITSGMITSVDADDFRKPTQLRASLAALATDPLIIRAVRKLAERFLDGQPAEMKKAEMAAALGVSESELENSLRPLVADDMLLLRKSAAGEETYELHPSEPDVLLLQSLE